MRRHFTLIELLIVIAIIAILAGMLLPALSKVKSTARGVECLSRAKTINTLYQFYAEDEHGFIPYIYLYSKYTGYTREEHGSLYVNKADYALWMNYINKKQTKNLGYIYFTKEKWGPVGFCPDMNADPHGNSANLDKSPLVFAFYTGSFGTYYPNWKYFEGPIQKAKCPSKTNMCTESSGISATIPIVGNYTFFQVGNDGIVRTKKHNQKSSTFFLDGHGAQLSVTQMPVYRRGAFVGKPWTYPDNPESMSNASCTWFWRGRPATGYDRTTLDQ